VGGSALAAFPIVTAGFYSKDEILWEAFANHHPYFLYAGLVGAFLTSIYTFRLIFIVFHGEAKTDAHAGHGISHWLPLSVLLVLSTFVGAWITPPLHDVLPRAEGVVDEGAKHHLEMISAVIAVSGMAIAAWLFWGKRQLVSVLAGSMPGRLLSKLWYNAWGFDWVYDLLFVRTFLLAARVMRRDWLDWIIGFIPKLMRLGHNLLSYTQNGKVRWYALSIAGGAVIVLTLVIFI
jgi:NADH-quinone oxidoreductase subunit L